jgi:hypothetical protein
MVVVKMKLGIVKSHLTLHSNTRDDPAAPVHGSLRISLNNHDEVVPHCLITTSLVDRGYLRTRGSPGMACALVCQPLHSCNQAILVHAASRCKPNPMSCTPDARSRCPPWPSVCFPLPSNRQGVSTTMPGDVVTTRWHNLSGLGDSSLHRKRNDRAYCDGKILESLAPKHAKGYPYAKGVSELGNVSLYQMQFRLSSKPSLQKRQLCENDRLWHPREYCSFNVRKQSAIERYRGA